jgi:preprotein translocase subunit SecE
MSISGVPQKIGLYLKQVKTEAKKVNWPTRQETIKYSLIVVSISAAVAIFLGGFDLLFGAIVRKIVALFS